jgi:hypothetical protein
MTCQNCKQREATTTATRYQLWGWRDGRGLDQTPVHVCGACNVLPLTMTGQGFIADLDPDMAPIECDYCGELWCRGRCDPEPLVRVEPFGWEIP